MHGVLVLDPPIVLLDLTRLHLIITSWEQYIVNYHIYIWFHFIFYVNLIF